MARKEQENKKETEMQENAHCNCGKDCKCGCQEGKECTCGCGCGCCCRRKGIFKLLAILLVFLAGMGFNELLHSCCGRCPARGPKAMPMMPMGHHMAKMPNMAEGNGGTVIIINADGSVQPHHFGKKGCGCKKDCPCHKHKHGFKHNNAPKAEVAEEVSSVKEAVIVPVVPAE